MRVPWWAYRADYSRGAGAVVFFGFCAIGMFLIGTFISSPLLAEKVAQKSEDNKRAYKVEVVVPDEVVVIRALRYTDKADGVYSVDELIDGLREVAKDYEIRGITPVEAKLGNGSYTMALLVLVRPKLKLPPND